MWIVGGGAYLIRGQNSERIDDLFGGIGVGALARHEIEEGIKVHETGTVRIDDGQNALEVQFTLSVNAQTCN